jgi:hypothetical protein
MADKVNEPTHYKGKGYEVIDIIEFFDLNFHRGNILKYVLRAGKKQEAGYDELEKEMEDLQKAAWYLAREMKRIAKTMEGLSTDEGKS